MSRRIYIGLATTFHEPAIAIVDGDGRIVFAEATERRLQNKRALTHPADSIALMPTILNTYCEPDAELVIATTWSRRFLYGMWLASISGRFTFRSVREHGLKRNRLLVRKFQVPTVSAYMYHAQRMAGIGVLNAAHEVFGHLRAKLRRYDHHLTHAAHACYASPFDDAVCVVVDGMGETGSTAIYRYDGGRLRQLQNRFTIGSIGTFYMYLTELCGFEPRRGEEWKVMGLAAHGSVEPKTCALLRELIYVSRGQPRATPARRFQRALTRLESLRTNINDDFEAAANLAASGQLVFTELMTGILRNVSDKRISDNLVLCGGIALNSSFNGLLLERTNFARLFVPAAPADDGNALGAALLALAEDGGNTPQPSQQGYPYLGSRIDPITPVIAERLRRSARVRFLPDTIVQETARLLAAGNIVGWLQGRAELGPRALGNRSILADPRDEKMRDRINSNIKQRELFRPLAPAILHEYGADLFENYQESPYMERALRFTPRGAAQAPAAVHLDGTGRLQSVRRETNPRFHALLTEFCALTGVPVLLNTSFNLMGKPIVHSREDALALFYSADMDALAIGDCLIEKYPTGPVV